MLEHRPSIKYFLELRTDAGDYLLENSRDYTFQRVSCKRQNFFVYLSRGGSSLGAKGLESRGAHQVTRRPACPDSHLDRLCYFDDNQIYLLNIIPLHQPHQCLGCGGPFDFLPSEQWPGDRMESGRMRRRDPNGERQPRSQKGCGLVHHSVWKIIFKITLYVRAYSKSLRHYYTSCFRILFYLL